MKPCGCGCGNLISESDNRGRVRFYKLGHQRKGKTYPEQSLRMKRENNHNWKGGKWMHEGHFMILKPDHPNRDRHGYVYEHRYIMEQSIGRYLRRDEDVHHINGIKTDNRIENLQLMSHVRHISVTHTKDMSDRICVMCNLHKDSKIWFRHPATGEEWICNSCYHKLRRVRLRACPILAGQCITRGTRN